MYKIYPKSILKGLLFKRQQSRCLSMSTQLIPQSPILLRAYCDDDWSVVCDIHDRARPHELKGSCDANSFLPLAEDPEDIDNFHRSEKFVACIQGQVVGFVGVDDNLVAWLYVDPDYFGIGIGRELLQLGLELAGPQAWTVVLSGNTRARRLYASEGFQVVHTFEGSNAGYPCTCLELSFKPNPIKLPQEQTQFYAA
ncbi:acetyltransferase [Leptolyngbya sp. PCC 7375]|nr:acetyltransferase [Leptolyngbya sp. PCC 7375]